MQRFTFLNLHFDSSFILLVQESEGINASELAKDRTPLCNRIISSLLPGLF